MTMFADRERGFEAMFARDAEMKFRVAARRDRLLGLWAAEVLGKTGEEAKDYVAAILKFDCATAGADAEAQVRTDLAGRMPPDAVHQKCLELAVIAREQIIAEMS